ncbi:ABC transporter [Heterobasidion irregulare TC 32-1]|uniref:ABC transporter n=1 Tax=Heterobasidion irregulare (strain TC 32-1) TaxID=747525 RepID=W4JY36_HETIT|nr:ABC transporter [Heterobasidion irregulare TC 32-1]ETW78359.1 ABC transporter [Heterobasidion irregulare TC 32-1]
MAHTGHVWDCGVFACADTCYEVVVSFDFALLVRIVRDSDARILRYSGQLLNIVQTAVENRVVDKEALIRIAGGHVLASLISRILGNFRQRLTAILNGRIRRYYSVHTFHAMARLDVPTWEDPVVSEQVDATLPTSRSSIAWTAVNSLVGVGSVLVKLLSQVTVLISVLREQRDGPLLAILCFAEQILVLFKSEPMNSATGVWAATAADKDFVKSEGLKKLLTGDRHRKELVAGNLTDSLTAQYRELTGRLGDRGGDFWGLYNEWKMKHSNNFMSLLREPLSALPQIVFTLRAVQYPTSVPLSLASLSLIQQTSLSFSATITQFLSQVGSVSNRLSSLRQLYEVANIPNRIQDGNAPFPEDPQTIRAGISLEFRHVSFQYAGSEDHALRDVSFKMEPGQLCVIVGANGSGKSTILKLVARIYDPTEGVILLDGKDIKTLRLADLRRAMAILFQDYSHFPLSIRDNIALGDPECVPDEDKVREAARLGGALEFIERLPEGLDTYLERPVRDVYSTLPEGTQTLFGRPVEYGSVRSFMSGDSPNKMMLSGGQMQRLAVSRTFMRSSVSDPKVGLLLFDEPSASLDPTAEHDLFARLRELRGNKTMVFSTHRFGNLTRHADIILYMNDAAIVEVGTHNELMKCEGEYARLWRMQAEAFL